MKEVICLLISLAAGLIAVLTNFYMFAFLMNFQVPSLAFPNTVDISPDWHDPPHISSTPLWNNLLLSLGFGLQHSGMVRGPAKKLLLLFFSEENTRILFVASTSVYLICVFYCWSPMLYVLWDIQQYHLRLFIYTFSLFCWTGVAVSLLTLDPMNLLGIKAPLNRILKRKDMEMDFITTGVYGLMRHPTYTFLILGFWVIPTMSIGHFLLSTVFTGYILFAVPYFEEPDLVRSIGPVYIDYMRTTPRYIPNICFSQAASRKNKE